MKIMYISDLCLILVHLVHWVNSILTYCKKSRDGFPRILLVATHKDRVQKVIKFENLLRTNTHNMNMTK